MKTQVLCQWHPSRLDKPTIFREFRELLESYGFVIKRRADVSVRDERDQRVLIERNDRSLRWHDDGNLSGRLFAVWSNVFPTETSPPIHACDGDVILIDNLNSEHRMTSNLNNIKGRWFARCANLE